MKEQYALAVAAFNQFYTKFPEYYREVGATRDAVDSEFVFADTLFKRGYCYLQLGDAGYSMEDFSTLIAASNHGYYKDKAYHFRAKLFAKKADWWRVIEDNTMALTLNPEMMNAYKDRAIAFDFLGEDKRAEEDRKQYHLLQRKLLWQGN